MKLNISLGFMPASIFLSDTNLLCISMMKGLCDRQISDSTTFEDPTSSFPLCQNTKDMNWHIHPIRMKRVWQGHYTEATFLNIPRTHPPFPLSPSPPLLSPASRWRLQHRCSRQPKDKWCGLLDETGRQSLIKAPLIRAPDCPLGRGDNDRLRMWLQ